MAYALVNWTATQQVSVVSSKGVNKDLIENISTEGKTTWKGKKYNAVVLEVSDKKSELISSMEAWKENVSKEESDESGGSGSGPDDEASSTDDLEEEAQPLKKQREYDLKRQSSLLATMTLKQKRSEEEDEKISSKKQKLGSQSEPQILSVLAQNQKSPTKAAKNVSSKPQLAVVAKKVKVLPSLSPSKKAKASPSKKVKASPSKKAKVSPLYSKMAKVSSSPSKIGTSCKSRKLKSPSKVAKSKPDVCTDEKPITNIERIENLERRVLKLEKYHPSHSSLEDEGVPRNITEFVDDATLQRIRRANGKDESGIAKDLMSAVFSVSEIARSSRTGNSSPKSAEPQRREKLDSEKVRAIYDFIHSELQVLDGKYKKKVDRLIGIAFAEKAKEARRQVKKQSIASHTRTHLPVGQQEVSRENPDVMLVESKESDSEEENGK